MKRLLLAPLFLFLFSCSSNAVKEPEVEKEPVSSIYERFDEFNNSTRWSLNIWSTNKVLGNDFKKADVLLSLSCTKYAPDSESGISGSYSFSIAPPNSLVYSLRSFADLKWDEEQPESKEYKYSMGTYGDYAFFYYSKDLIKKLAKHSTLKIRYSTLSQGTQTAEFSLVGERQKNNYSNYFPLEQDISELIKKCDSI